MLATENEQKCWIQELLAFLSESAFSLNVKDNKMKISSMFIYESVCDKTVRDILFGLRQHRLFATY